MSPRNANAKPKPYRLGLDIGTNSIGWAILDVDAKGKPTKLRDAGVRIFSQGRDPKALTTLNATRRQKRHMSRQRDRYLRRRNKVIQTLIRHGLFPKDEVERKKLVDLNPYRLRAEALKKKLPVEHVARALFHLNQRRGFKSNRKTDRGADNDKGLIHSSIRAFKKKAGDKTVGQYLWQQLQKNETIRARRFGVTQKDLYVVYTDRAMVEDEFNKIWTAQAKHHPKIMTTKARDDIHSAIFSQRPLKPPIVGRCQFMPEHERAPWSLPSAQNFRIYQELNNLGWWTHNDDALDRARMLVEHDDGDLTLRNILFEKLQTTKKCSFNSIRKILAKHGVEDIKTFNLEQNRDHLLGNATACLMTGTAKKPGYIGEEWKDWPLEKRDEFILLLEDHHLNDEEVVDKLQADWELGEEQARNCIEAPLPDGHSNLCLEAIRKITPPMETGLRYDKAVQAAGFDHHSDRGYKGDLKPNLPPYDEVLRTDATDFADPNKEEQIKKLYPNMQMKRFPNPTVHIALNQLRRIVNELIRLHGPPTSIISEIGRDVRKGAEELKEWNVRQNQNRRDNERINEAIIGGTNIKTPTRADRQKYMLWEELADNPHDRGCIGCGKIINISNLFSADIEIEHILPRAATLDDSMNNKTLFCRKCNRDKGKQSPFEAFGKNKNWNEISQRVENLRSPRSAPGRRMPSSKKWRFGPDAMQEFLNEHEDFLARQLNDMRYISRLARDYLRVICEDITTTPGRVTSDIRYYLGYKTKDRDTHRNHALDAVVVGLTDRSLLQKLADLYQKDRKPKEEEEFMKQALGEKFNRKDIDDVIDNIVVSHKVSKSRGGALHEETAYGLDKQQEQEDLELKPGKAQKNIAVTHRIALESVTDSKTLDRITDERIKEELHKCTNGKSPADFKKAVAAFSNQTGIRRVKVNKNLTGIPFRTNIKAWSKRKNKLIDQQGWKIYPGGNNWCYEIYETDNGKWDGEIISRYDANQKSFVPQWKKDFPTKKLLMRLFIDSTVLFRAELEDDETPIQNHIYRIQKITKGMIAFAPLHEANVDKRNRDKEDKFKFFYKGPNALKTVKAVQVDISPTGLVNIRHRTDD